MGRILVCQPMGGINDSLCQVGMCIEYAIKYNRKLIIDTNMVSDFDDHLSNYFQLQDGYDFIQLSINREEYTQINSERFVCERSFPEVKPINRNIDYPDNVILHRSYGGGFDSMIAMRYLKLSESLSTRIKTLVSQLGTYRTVMIRNSDYKTDYKDELSAIEKLNLTVPLMLTTDDYKVQDYAKTLKFSKLIINENLQKNNLIDLPIMHLSRSFPEIKPKQINDEVLVDLFLAASSEHIYPTRVVGTANNRQFENENVTSGFILLAMGLNKDRVLLSKIIG